MIPNEPVSSHLQELLENSLFNLYHTTFATASTILICKYTNTLFPIPPDRKHVESQLEVSPEGSGPQGVWLRVNA